MTKEPPEGLSRLLGFQIYKKPKKWIVIPPHLPPLLPVFMKKMYVHKRHYIGKEIGSDGLLRHEYNIEGKYIDSPEWVQLSNKDYEKLKSDPHKILKGIERNQFKIELCRAKEGVLAGKLGDKDWIYIDGLTFFILRNYDVQALININGLLGDNEQLREYLIQHPDIMNPNKYWMNCNFLEKFDLLIGKIVNGNLEKMIKPGGNPFAIIARSLKNLRIDKYRKETRKSSIPPVDLIDGESLSIRPPDPEVLANRIIIECEKRLSGGLGQQRQIAKQLLTLNIIEKMGVPTQVEVAHAIGRSVKTLERAGINQDTIREWMEEETKGWLP